MPREQKTFREFIVEAKDAKPNALDTIVRNQQRNRPHLTLSASRTPSGAIRVHGFHVKPEYQNQGTGSIVMRAFTNYADRINSPIVLNPSAKPGKEKDLRRFYGRFEFKKVPDSDNLIRHPKPRKSVTHHID